MNITTRTHAFINSTATTTVAASVAADTYTDVQMVFIYVAMVLLSAFTVIGNIAVFVAYFRTPDLQNSTNYFILSLATADVVIGLISVNFYTVYLAYGYWPLNEVLCDFWLCADYWCCQASVLNLVVISVDRLFSIKYPVAYRSRRSDAIVKKSSSLSGSSLFCCGCHGLFLTNSFKANVPSQLIAVTSSFCMRVGTLRSLQHALATTAQSCSYQLFT